MSDWNDSIVEEFRANEGKVGGVFEGKPLLILHHRGAKSGTERISPLMYQDVNGSYAIFASKGGADSNPDWFYNIKANPETSIEVGTDKVDVRARIVPIDDPEYYAIWEQQKRDYPQFAGYEQKTPRNHIPVIVLDPA
jgi:deazaflavin-dependent oxidoreductase (nitroreductase family)